MQNPAMMMQQNPCCNADATTSSTDNFTNRIRKAKLIAEMMIDYAKEEDKITGDAGGDPLLKLKSREIRPQSKSRSREK